MKRLALLLIIALSLIAYAPARATGKTVYAAYYPYYPWAGMHWLAGGVPVVPLNVRGFVRQDAFTVKQVIGIPYLRSAEHPKGRVDHAAAVWWHRANLQQAANAGIDVLLVIGQVDIPEWSEILATLFEARHSVVGAPTIAIYFDGIQRWEHSTPDVGTLSGPGPDYDAVREGALNTLTVTMQYASDLDWHGTALPIWFYRIEGTAGPYTATNWWLDQLRTDVAAAFDGLALYITLDHYWYGDAPYGNGIVLSVTNADNYSYWGGALYGAFISSHADPDCKVASVGPGFDASFTNPGAPVRPRDGGTWYLQNWAIATGTAGLCGVIVETLNFGEEGSGIGDGFPFRYQYIDMTNALATAWKT